MTEVLRTPVLSNRTGRSGQRNPGHATQRRNTQPSGKGGFYSNMFLVPKKDGRQRSVFNLKKLNGGSAYVERQSQARGLISKNRPEDAYFMIPVHHQDRKFLRFQNQGKTYVSIQVPTIRPIQCTLGLYQDHTSSSDPPQRVGSPNGCLYTGNG